MKNSTSNLGLRNIYNISNSDYITSTNIASTYLSLTGGSITGAITLPNVDSSIVMGTNDSISCNSKTITSIELSYLDGVTSSIQDQINLKQQIYYYSYGSTAFTDQLNSSIDTAFVIVNFTNLSTNTITNTYNPSGIYSISSGNITMSVVGTFKVTCSISVSGNGSSANTFMMKIIKHSDSVYTDYAVSSGNIPNGSSNYLSTTTCSAIITTTNILDNIHIKRKQLTASICYLVNFQLTIERIA